MNTTPLQMATSYEAENQEAPGKLADSLLAHPELQQLMEVHGLLHRYLDRALRDR